MCVDCLSKNKVKVEIYPKMALLIKTEITGSVFVPFLCLEFLQLNLTTIEWDT